MQDRFSDEDRHAHHLLCLEPSIIVNKGTAAGLASHAGVFWVSSYFIRAPLTDRELPNNLLLALDEGAFPNIYRLLVVTCPLTITSGEAELSFSLMK